MKKKQIDKNLESARINIYNILAILIVIIPELFAETIYSIGISQHNNKLPRQGEAWQKNIELKLSTMRLFELRLFAKKLNIHGYSNENRNSLIRRIKKNIKNEIQGKY